tara:strand:+ start:1260 stop:2483 length:1224 start_codon:yes stop_codon:yes gene_type:complete
MRKLLLTLGVIFSILVTIPFVDAQLFEKATFQETATILYDQKFSNSVISSIGFETTNNEEIRFSNEVIQKINDNEKIKAVIFTNAGECVIGVTTEEQCIMINFNYQQLKGDGGIRMVQDSAKEMGEKIINELNEALGMKGEFHSTFIHTVDDANILLETSGVVSGRGSVSATYVMPKQSTDFLFADLAGKLLPKEIREGGGFYEISKKLAKNDNSIISISIIRNENSNLFMFKVADETKNTSEDISKINVLENLGVENISRSDIFDGRNVPLNSVIQLLIIPKEQSKIDAIATHAITDLTKLENISNKGWFFESPAGYKIDARFLFGQDKVILHNELRMEIGPWNGESEVSFYSVENIENEGHGSMSDVMKENSEVEEQSQYIILGIIIAAGIGAAIFYLKGYKPKR